MAGTNPAMTWRVLGRSEQGAEALSLARRLEHRRVERLAGGLAGPDHELERWEIALAAFERARQQRLALLARGLAPAGENQLMAEHHHAVLGPQVEMADPQLLVDERDQLLHLVAAALR